MNDPERSAVATESPREKGQSGTMRIYFALTAPAAMSIALYAAAEGSWSIFALATLIGACAFALGALLGFLFGIPQYFAGADTPSERSRATYQPNTNLTQVSDWLTKIIIGVGLVRGTYERPDSSVPHQVDRCPQDRLNHLVRGQLLVLDPEASSDLR